jgi:hypothetical protein
MQPDQAVAAYERALEYRLHNPLASDAEAAFLGREVRKRIGDRTALGAGTLRQRFAPVFAAWATRHPLDPDGQRLLSAFCQHPSYAQWQEVPGQAKGLCREEAFASFAASLAWTDPAELARCRFSSLIRALAIDPDPAFLLPPVLRRRPGCDLILDRSHGRLYALVNGKVIIGRLTPLSADLLEGLDPHAIAARAGLDRAELLPLEKRLTELGLLGLKRPAHLEPEFLGDVQADYSPQPAQFAGG